MRKKEISTDKLLLALESLPKHRTTSKAPSALEIKQYIDFYKITDGDFPVPSFLIYNHYLKWCQDRTPFAEQVFFRQFNKYFKRKRGFLYSFYKVNLESLGLSYSDYQKIITEVNDVQKEANRQANKKHRESKKNKAE